MSDQSGMTGAHERIVGEVTVEHVEDDKQA